MSEKEEEEEEEERDSQAESLEGYDPPSIILRFFFCPARFKRPISTLELDTASS